MAAFRFPKTEVVLSQP